MKVTHIYDLGQKVWAIARKYEKGEPTCFVVILPAIVKGVYINEDGIDYILKTPKGDEWGEYVPETEVSITFEDLTSKMKREWEDFAEWE